MAASISGAAQGAAAAARLCHACDVTKPPGEFEKGRAVCKPCRAARAREYRKAPPLELATLPPVRTCARCETEKPLAAFEMTPSGPRPECKPCRALKRKEAVAGAPKVDRASVKKPEACSGCGKGPAEVNFQWRGENKAGGWRAICDGCFGAKMYHTVYRDKKRAEDEPGFLKHNSEVMSAWRSRNPEAVKEQQMLTETTPERKIKKIVASAHRRGQEVTQEDVDAMRDKLVESCHFCAYLPPPGEALNSLCRASGGTTFSNDATVTACRSCVALKHTMTSELFIAQARRVVMHLGLGLPDEGVERLRPFSFGGTADRRAAPEKKKRDELTMEQRRALTSQPCYMCGQSPSFGVDRLDSAGDYTIANARPCCTACNYMKKDFGLDSVLAHLRHIAGTHPGVGPRRPQLRCP